VSARSRIVLLVAGIAAAAAVVVAATALSSGGGSGTTTSAEPKARSGRPPLAFALGFRTDAEARDLARGAALYQRGDLEAAHSLFAKHDSLEAKVGAAFATWPDGSLDRLEQLAKLYPKSAVVQVHLGLARFWANRGDSDAAWQAALDAEPDTPYAIVAGNLLHPNLPRGLPTFIPSFTAAPSVSRLAPAKQLEALKRNASSGDLHALLLYGVGLQRVGRPVSAAAVFQQAARRYPGNAEARVAAAVGQFDKDEPAIAFGRLGPLTRTFPNEPTVRFHLGVLLLWTGRVKEAERQFRLASREKSGSPLAQEAARYLETITKAKG
jgi:tetratricopeptide (TPR) repeat protein